MSYRADQIRPLAETLCVHLRDACPQVTLAGSLRRGVPEIKDIELVAQLDADLPEHLALHAVNRQVLTGIQVGLWQFDTEVKRNGDRYKRLVACTGLGRIAIDLFLATEQNFGNILAIRTGNAEFSHRLVMSRHTGGLLPDHLVHREGALWQWREYGREGKRLGKAIFIPCPREETFFVECGLPWIPPAERNLERALDMAQQFRRADRRAS